MLSFFSFLGCSNHSFYQSLSGTWLVKETGQEIQLPGKVIYSQKHSITLEKKISLFRPGETNHLAIFLGEISWPETVLINQKVLTKETRQYFPINLERRRVYIIDKTLLFQGINTIGLAFSNAKGSTIAITANEIFIADLTSVQRNQNRRLLFLGFICTFTFILGIYFISIYFLLNLNKENLYFGILAILLGVYLFFYQETKYLLGNDLLLLKRIEFSLLYALPTFYLWFVVDLLKLPHRKLILGVSFIGLCLLPLIFFFAQPERFAIIRRFWQIYFICLCVPGAVIHFRKRNRLKQGSKYVVLAYSTLILFGFVDMARTFEFHRADRMAYLGIFSFSLFMSIALVRRLQHIQKFLLNQSNRLKKSRNILQRAVRLQTFQLQEKNKQVIDLANQQRKFFAQMSHDLRTPLSMLTIPIEALLKNIDELSEKQWQRLSKIKVNTYKLIGMLNDLLDIAKLRENKATLNLVKGNLAAFVFDIVQEFKPIAQLNLNSLSIQYEPSQIETAFDAEKIEKIVINLLSNALKFNRPAKPIQVKIFFANHHFKFSVRDFGIGIEKEKLQEIFLPFEQAHNHITKHGTGLGLAIVKEFVELHQGQVRVESKLQQFTEFTFHIPINAFKAPTLKPVRAQRTYEMLETLETTFDLQAQNNPHEVLRIYGDPKPLLKNCKAILKHYVTKIQRKKFLFKKAKIHLVYANALGPKAIKSLQGWPKQDHSARILITSRTRLVNYVDNIFDQIIYLPFHPNELLASLQRIESEFYLRNRLKEIEQRFALWKNLTYQANTKTNIVSLENFKLKKFGTTHSNIATSAKLEKGQRLTLITLDKNEDDFAPILTQWLHATAATVSSTSLLNQILKIKERARLLTAIVIDLKKNSLNIVTSENILILSQRGKGIVNHKLSKSSKRNKAVSLKNQKRIFICCLADKTKKIEQIKMACLAENSLKGVTIFSLQPRKIKL